MKLVMSLGLVLYSRLLTEPPGTGKTRFAPALPDSWAIKFMLVNTGTLVSKYHGETAATA